MVIVNEKYDEHGDNLKSEKYHSLFAVFRA